MKTILKSIIAAGLFVMVFSLSACMNYTKGSGNVVTERKAVAAFEELSINGAFDVYIKQGEIADLEVETDDNLQKNIIILNESGKLSVSTDGSVRGATTMKLYVTVTNLKELDLDGAVDVIGKNEMKLDDLHIDADGAVEIELNLSLDKLEMTCDGASEVKLVGKCNNAAIRIDGAGELQATDFEIEDLDIEIDGAGSAKVSVRDNLKAEVDGAGSILYKGTPNVSSEINGAGSIRKF